MSTDGSQVQLHDGKKKENIFLRFLKAVWGTRQTRDTSNDSDLLIKTTLKELIIYIVFLVIICIITFGMTNPINFYYVNVMMNLFLSAESDSGLSFSSMASMSDFWEVHTGPVMDGLYNGETWYNGDNASQYGYIYFENKILGVPRFRQMRVKKNSCKVHKLFQSMISDCYDSYGSFSEDQTSFGIYGNPAYLNDTTYDAFYYQKESVLKGPSVSGTIASYGGGGYVQNLGSSKEASVAIAETLKNNGWTDRGTRAAFLDFTIYNANINLFCQIRLITEFPATGGVIPSSMFRSVKLIRYVTSMDYFVLFCEIVFGLFVLYYTIEEILEIRIHKLSYFKEVWNVLDVVILIVCYVCIFFNIYRVIEVNQLLDTLLSNSNQFLEFESLAYWQIAFNNAIAIIAFLSWMKLFKYIKFNKSMTQLSSTLERCAKDILGFLVMFYIVFFAYAQLGYLLFGATTPDYSTFTTTMFTLFRIILGDFDFPTLEANSRTLGPIYFLSYVFFVFFVLLNMFLAIINDTYSDVKSDIEGSKDEFELGAYFKKNYDKILTKINLKKEKIVDIQDAIDFADQNNDNHINFDEWRAELRKRGYADVEIEAYFAKYDTDGNRNLTEEEMQKMREDLKKQVDSIDDNMNTFKDEANKDLEEMTAEEEAERRANLVSSQEFSILTSRVDTMENSIGNIVDKIDNVLSKLDLIETTKYKRRESMARLLNKLNEANTVQDDTQRLALQKMVKDELEKWDEPINITPIQGYTSRAASPPSYNSSNLDVRGKTAWRQQ